MKDDNPEKEFLISFSDIISILKRGRRKILLGAVLCPALLGFYSLTKPIAYRAEATFRERSNSSGGLNRSFFADAFLGGFMQSQRSEAVSMMRSKKFLYRLIKEMGLQAQITERGSANSFWGDFWDNIRVEYSYFRNKNALPLPDLNLPLTIKTAEYRGELTKSFKIVFQESGLYEVYNIKEEKVGEGSLGKEFVADDFSFTLVPSRKISLEGRVFCIALTPLYDVAEALAKSLLIDLDKIDKQMVKISYNHRDRHFAARLVNRLMLEYKKFLKEELSKITSRQIAYLNDRSAQMGQVLRVMLDNYADMMSKEVADMGHPDTVKALDFLSSLLAKYEEEILAVDLELKRQERSNEQMEEKGCAGCQYETAPPDILELVSKIKSLKQRGDGIELAIRAVSSKDIEHWEKTFRDQLGDLDKIKKSAEEARVILASLENDVYPMPRVGILESAKYAMKTWHDRLENYRLAYEEAGLWEKDVREGELRLYKEQFAAYIRNLIHYLEVAEKAILERLVHQQAPQFEFQGIDLKTADELYLRHSKELSAIESEIVQLEFIIEQLKNPEFEISSLGVVIQDPVTTGMINKAGEYILAIQDESNRSLKEKERLQEELRIQKKFLKIHLAQTINLLRLKEGLIREKISSLQKASLELIRQQISIMEQELRDAIEDHIVNLKQKKELNRQQIEHIREKMVKIPGRWAQEKMIEQELKTESVMLEELTKLIESKNIAINLEMIQSSPLDFAVAKIKPERPRLRLFLLMGAFLGALLVTITLFARALLYGLPASADNLKLYGAHVSGNLTGVISHDQKIYGKFVSYLLTSGTLPKAIAIIKGRGRVSQIAKELSKRGLRVALLAFSPDIPKKREGDYFDTLSVSSEVAVGPKFSRFLEDLKKEYDCLLAEFGAADEDGDLESICHYFDGVGYFVSGDSLQSLHSFLEIAKRYPNRQVSFFIEG